MYVCMHTALDNNGDMPLDLAIDYKRQEMTKFLLTRGCPCAKHDRQKAIKESEWIPDPLWPEGYKKDLLADSDEDGAGDTDTGRNTLGTQ